MPASSFAIVACLLDVSYACFYFFSVSCLFDMSCLLLVLFVVQVFDQFGQTKVLHREIGTVFKVKTTTCSFFFLLLQAYDAAINDLTEVAEQQAGRPNRIDDLMAQAEKVGLRRRVCATIFFFFAFFSHSGRRVGRVCREHNGNEDETTETQHLLRRSGGPGIVVPTDRCFRRAHTKLPSHSVL